MPQRSNRFQSLITQIQHALHDVSADVEITESAMIMDHAAGAEIEVDILVEFKKGGLQYRTVVECQDRSRPAGPAWIRELRTKRDDCRVDKIVAVHSQGFSKNALKLAEQHNIGTIHPEDVTDEQWVQSLLSNQAYIFYTVEASIPVEQYSFDAGGVPPENCDKPKTICRFDKTHDRSMDELFRLAHRLLENHVVEQYVVRRNSSDLPTVDAEFVGEFTITFPEDTKLIYTNGTELPLKAARGFASVSLIVFPLLPSRFFGYGDDKIVQFSATQLGNKFQVVAENDGPGASIEVDEKIVNLDVKADELPNIKIEFAINHRIDRGRLDSTLCQY